MHYQGLIVGAVSFLLIGAFHVIVIKTEYYFSKNAWPVYLLLGSACLVLSLFVEESSLCSILGITGFTVLWCIRELFQQEQRVKKGWFSANPRRVQREHKFEREKVS